MIHSRYQIDKARHNLKKDWERLCKAKGSSADLRVTPQTDVYSIEDAQQTSEHNVFNFPGVQGEARKMLPIIEVIDPAFDPDYLDDDVLEAVLVEQKVGAAPVNEGDTDYSRDNYIIISVSWASLRYVVEQRHALSKHRDMKDDSVVDVVKEFERVNKSLIKEAFVQVCSYKNNMIGPDLKIIMKTQEEARNDPPESFPPTDARYWRQPTPGMRAEKCNDDNKPIVGRYKCMTTSSEPKWHGDQTLNATLCDTLVIREGTQPQYYQINVETISATAAALGNEFHREKIRSMEQSKENKPLDWNIDIRTHYERYLKLCHPPERAVSRRHLVGPRGDSFGVQPTMVGAQQAKTLYQRLLQTFPAVLRVGA